MGIKKLTTFESLLSLDLLVKDNWLIFAATIATQGGIMWKFWGYIESAAAIDGWWLYPVVIIILFAAFVAFFMSTKWLWNRLFPSKQESTAPVSVPPLTRRIPLNEQRRFADIISGHNLGQDTLDVLYFHASEECGDLAADIAQAARLAGWDAKAGTSIFGDDPHRYDVNLNIAGEGYRPSVTIAL